jgi:hypothetical protein
MDGKNRFLPTTYHTLGEERSMTSIDLNMSSFDEIVQKLGLSLEQEKLLCELIGRWYFLWKKKICEPGIEHRLGYASNQLKELVCNRFRDSSTFSG